MTPLSLRPSTGTTSRLWVASYPYGKLASNMRDRKLSELGTLVWWGRQEGGTLNTGRDDSSKPKRRPSVVQLGQGKWPDDFIDAA